MKIAEVMKKGLVVANKNGVSQSMNSNIVPSNFSVSKECCVLGLILLGKYGFKRVCTMAERRAYNLYKENSDDTFYTLIFKHFPQITGGNVGSIYHLNDTLGLSFEKCIEEVEKMEAEGFF